MSGKGSWPLVNVHLAQFRAAVQDGKHLARIEQVLFIERAFDALLLLQVRVGEHVGHQVTLFDPDTVLTGQDAANLHAQAQDIGTEFFRRIQLRPACSRRRELAGEDCRLRRERRWQHRVRAFPTIRASVPEPSAVPGGVWCRPCTDSPARSARRRERRPCARPRTSCALLRSREMRTWLAWFAFAISSTRPIRKLTSSSGPSSSTISSASTSRG